MSIVRELTTVLDFKSEPSGLREYEKQVQSSLNTIKNTLLTLGSAFGATFAFEGVKSTIMGVIDGVKQLNKATFQLTQILTPDQDVDAILKQIYDFAQETGDTVLETTNRFKAMAIAASEVGVSQTTALTALQNVTKALEVGKVFGDEADQVFERVNMALRRGQLSARSFGEILQEAPGVVNTLAENLGVSVKQLRELAAKGKLTTEVLIKGFARTNEALNAAFDDPSRPVRLAEAFNYVYNEIIRVGQVLWKMGGTTSYIAKNIIWLTQTIVRWGNTFVDYVGGAENAIRLFGIALGVAVGAKALQMILTMTSALRAMGIAASVASIKFLAIAAAVVAIALAIDDLVAWFQGRDSLIGRMVGPFENLRDQFNLMIAPFQALKQLFTGDFSGAFDTLVGAIQNVHSTTDALLLIIPTVAAAFLAWNVISFVGGILAALGSVISKTGAVRAIVWAVEAAYKLWNLLGFGGLISSLGSAIVKTEAVTAATATAKAAFEGLNLIQFAPLIAAIGLITAAITAVIVENTRLEANIKKTQDDIEKRRAAGLGTPSVAELATDIGLHPLQAREAASATGYYKREGIMGDIEDWYQEQKRNIRDIMPTEIFGMTLPTVKAAEKVDEALRQPLDPELVGKSWWERNVTGNLPVWAGGQQMMPQGALGPPAAPPAPVITNNTPVTVNPSITVTAPVSELDRITAVVSQSVSSALDGMTQMIARQLTSAAPVTEARPAP